MEKDLREKKNATNVWKCIFNTFSKPNNCTTPRSIMTSQSSRETGNVEMRTTGRGITFENKTHPTSTKWVGGKWG